MSNDFLRAYEQFALNLPSGDATWSQPPASHFLSPGFVSTTTDLCRRFTNHTGPAHFRKGRFLERVQRLAIDRSQKSVSVSFIPSFLRKGVFSFITSKEKENFKKA